MKFNKQQRDILGGYLHDFLVSKSFINEGFERPYKEFDRLRIEALTHLNGLVDDFLSKKTDLIQFKEASEGLCRKYPYWGFKSFSGQMQLNQYANNIPDAGKEDVLRQAISIPVNREIVKSRINHYCPVD